jgi:hypothetical protein
LKFLIESFCSIHRAELDNLLSTVDCESLQPHDLRTLADLLLDSCGGEENFILHGSAMDRVRRVLLLAGGEPLPLFAIANQTRLNLASLRRKLNRHAGKWVQLIPVS